MFSSSYQRSPNQVYMAYYCTCIKIQTHSCAHIHTRAHVCARAHTHTENEYQMLVRMQRREITEGWQVEVKWGTATLEIGVIGSYKTKHTITIQFSNFTLGHSYQRNKNLYPHKNPYANVHSSFIPNSQSLEIIQISFNRRMVTTN